MGIAEFKHYLFQRPSSVANEKLLLAILKDAMCNESKKYQDLCQAYNAGILDAIKASNPPNDNDLKHIIWDLQTNRGLVEQAAKATVDFWVKSFEGFSFDGLDSLTSFMELPRPMSEEGAVTGPNLTGISYNPLRREVLIQWRRDQQADGYEVWRSTGQNRATLVKDGSFPLPRFIDKDTVPGEVCSYVIRSKIKNSEKYSEFSNMLQIAIPDGNSTFEISEVRVLNDGIQLRWTYQTAAEHYLIKRTDLIANEGEVHFSVSNSSFVFIDTFQPGELQLKYYLECERRNQSPLVTHEIVLTV